MNKYTHTTGEKIRAARLRLGLTQQQLADRLNDALSGPEIVERTVISRWEKDKNFPANGRVKVLEDLLGIELGNPPTRRETSASYVTTRQEIADCLAIGLQDCTELWMTSVFDPHTIYNEIDSAQVRLEELRQDPNCRFREIVYIRNNEELRRGRDEAKKQHPNYSLRIRTAPGHPFPVLLAPNSRFAMFLSGFFDDVSSVALELVGQVAGFNEHYLRHIWHKATPIYEDGQFNEENYASAEKMLEWFGGDVRNEFSKAPRL